MRISQKKLEEIMYLSLIGEYAYMQVAQKEYLLGFSASRALNDLKIKPICITSTKAVSDKVVEERTKNFEEKVFDKNADLVKALKKEEKLSFSKRMNIVVKNYYRSDKLFLLYEINLNNLQKGGIIDKNQYNASVGYVNKLREKIRIKNNSKTL